MRLGHYDLCVCHLVSIECIGQVEEAISKKNRDLLGRGSELAKYLEDLGQIPATCEDSYSRTGAPIGAHKRDGLEELRHRQTGEYTYRYLSARNILSAFCHGS
jgi:hypothetical protein